MVFTHTAYPFNVRVYDRLKNIYAYEALKMNRKVLHGIKLQPQVLDSARNNEVSVRVRHFDKMNPFRLSMR